MAIYSHIINCYSLQFLFVKNIKVHINYKCCSVLNILNDWLHYSTLFKEDAISIFRNLKCMEKLTISENKQVISILFI